MPSAADPVRLGQLMEDLYAKKKWLDRVIASLESAVDSPDYRLIAALTEAFEHDEKSAAKVDLRQFQHARIAKLADDVTVRKSSLEVARGSTARPLPNGVSSASSEAKRQPEETEGAAHPV